MSLQVERLEGNMAKLTIEVSAEAFEKAVNDAYLKNRGKIQIQGFRKGKAPRKMIEHIYGEGVFYEDAANELIPKAYEEELESEEGKALEVVSQPEIDVEQIGHGQPFIFTAMVALKPEVTLGQYRDFDIEKKTAEVTEEDLQEELDRVRDQNSRTISVEDRPLQDGDTANIDYEGFSDGTAFEGGKGENHDLVIGSHSFIDTFEEQLIGMNIGEEKEINVTFPEEYHAPELAGKPAVFKVKLNGIKAKEMPELNDEFAEEVSDFETLEEYKEDLKKKIAERKQTELDSERRDEIVKRAVENAEMVIPDAMIDFQARQMLNDYGQRLQAQGLSLDMYLQYTGQTMDQAKEQMKDQARSRIENSLVLEAIAEKEGVEVSEEDIEQELQKMADMYQMEKEKIRELMGDNEKESMKKDLAIQKALDIITA